MVLMLCIQALLTFLYGVDTSTLSIVILLATNCSNVSICSNNNKIWELYSSLHQSQYVVF